jgi:hypothetical protein
MGQEGMMTMNVGTGRARTMAWALVLLFAISGHAAAQSEMRISLSAGVSEFDLSGTGDSFTASGRVDFPLKSFLGLEAGVGALFPAQQFGDTTIVLLPEAQVQVQLDRRVAPYLGVGLGASFDLREEVDGGTVADPTVNGALGIRYLLVDALGLRAEARVRYHGTGFTGTTVDLTGGISWRF